MRCRPLRACVAGIAGVPMVIGLLVTPIGSTWAAVADPTLPDPVVSTGAPWEGTITETAHSDNGSDIAFDAGPSSAKISYTGLSFLVDYSSSQSCSSSVVTRLTATGQGEAFGDEAWDLPVYWQARGVESCSGSYKYADTWSDLVDGKHHSCSFTLSSTFALDTPGDEPLKLSFDHNVVSSWNAYAYHQSDSTWGTALSDSCGQLSAYPWRIALSHSSRLEMSRANPAPADIDVDDVLRGTDTYSAMDRPAINGSATWELTYNGRAGKAEPTVVSFAAGEKGQLGSVCGRAAFDWRHVTLRKMTVKDGERACVFLVGNELTKQLLTVAVRQGIPLGKAFAGTILKELTPEMAPKVATWSAKWTAKKVLLRAIANAVGARAGAFTPLTAVGTVVALNAVPLAGLFVTSQIKNHDACLQVVVDVDHGHLNADWSMVYAHSGDPGKTRAKVYKKLKQFGPDEAKAVPLPLHCQPSGKVQVTASGTKAMKGDITSLFKVKK